MNMKFRKTLIAGAIAALTTGTAWAAETPKYGSDAPAKTGIEQPARDAPAQSGMEQPARDEANAQRAPQPGERSMDSQAQRSDTSGPSSADKEIYTRSADSLAGADVVDGDGEKIGDVKQVVLSADRKSAHAVISEGGILGIGGREVRVSLDELTPLDDDKLQWRVTKEQVEMLEEHTPGQFVEIKGDTPISGEITEFSAFEPMKKDIDQPQAVPSMPKSSADDPAVAPMAPKSPQ
jgi:sporulation protein YlmC with PRC-barrel domain